MSDGRGEGLSVPISNPYRLLVGRFRETGLATSCQGTLDDKPGRHQHGSQFHHHRGAFVIQIASVFDARDPSLERSHNPPLPVSMRSDTALRAPGLLHDRPKLFGAELLMRRIIPQARNTPGGTDLDDGCPAPQLFPGCANAFHRSIALHVGTAATRQVLNP